MIDLQKLELFPKEIYVIEQFTTYRYYYQTVLLWEDLIQYAEKLLDQYSANLAPDHRSQHPSHQADYVWGTMVLPNFKGTLHHLLDGLEDLKAGFLPILRRMSSIRNDLIAQWRDYPYDWMDQVQKGASVVFKEKRDILSIRATNIYITSDYHDSQWDYKNLLEDRYLIGINFPNSLPKYKLNTAVMIKTDEPIMVTGIYRSTEPYSACKFLMQELKMGAENDDDWKLAPEVSAFENNPDLWTTPDTIEDPREVPTTWILVEQVTENNDADFVSNNLGISQKGGEKCSKTGYWTTPAQPDTRPYFTQGEILPTLSQTDWGEVYWYFDGLD
ncbi:hypothetical protein ACNPQK_07535 [Acinetobacter guillouiae]|uniref:hypothetical protein n=1 Tax=Acinetobacter TaxID=469 RepID=UPI00141B1A13|nr:MULTISPECIES: hypothetical protein [Acinetobacter]MCS4298073.1 hypothetical protein [Acinetobacter guillouiae]MCW2251677.1 hypothetical protein [Acinetobacter sp. BIGb0204]NII35826.1 hypothetical protein [Acinetobacter sp. BIGb0196]